MNIFWFSFSILLQNIRKKGRVEFCQIFHPRNGCTDICKTQFSTLNLNFTLKSVSLSNAILSFFSRHGPYFHPTKDRCSTSPSSPFFTFVLILVIFAALKSSNFFLWKIWDIRNSKRAANMNWWFFWMRNRGLLLPTFCTFLFKARP